MNDASIQIHLYCFQILVLIWENIDSIDMILQRLNRVIYKYEYKLEHIAKYFVSQVYREDTAKRIKFLAEFNETSFREVTDLYLQI